MNNGTYKYVEWEAQIKRQDSLQIRDLLGRESDTESLDVCVQVLDFTAANNWENIGGLLEDIRDGHYKGE